MRKLTSHEVKRCSWSLIEFDYDDPTCFYGILSQCEPKDGHEFLISVELSDQYGEYGDTYFGVLTSEGMYISNIYFYHVERGFERKLNDLSEIIGPMKALEFMEL